MTDQPDLPRNGQRRPRPQYGEYATPQEQAKIIADSLPPVSPLLVPSAVPQASRPPDASTRVGTVPPPPVARRPRRWDLILTAALLGYATINVIGQLAARDTLAAILKQFFVTQGIGEYTPTALTTSLGNLLNVVTLALFVLTVLATVWMLRRGRVAFWVPIAGGVLASIVALVFVVVLLGSDPAAIAYLRGIRP
ncbi:MAG: DUF6264 family protein [Actinomycetota bacterium]